MQTSTVRPQLGSVRRNLLSSSVRSAPVCSRNSRLIVRAEEDKSIKAQNPVVDRSDTRNIEAGNVTPEGAEKRADIGKERKPEFSEAQAFDGPAPETINGRLAMLGVLTCLAAEFNTGVGVKEQVAKSPLPILAVFVIISLASYIPIFRGYTRKEPFANSFWSPKAENWNGRLAMMGFAGILVTEALAGKTTLQFWGLQSGFDPSALP